MKNVEKFKELLEKILDKSYYDYDTMQYEKELIEMYSKNNVSAQVEEKDQEKLQEILDTVVRSYYNGIDRVVINFEDKKNVSMDDILTAMGCE